jgi:predicted GIY-YIG superfamily endonuclease
MPSGHRLTGLDKWEGQVIAAAIRKAERKRGPRAALYRLYGADGTLLYVGITFDPKTRFWQHGDRKEWWWEVARNTVTWYRSRYDALRAETAAIKTERPLYNTRGLPPE